MLNRKGPHHPRLCSLNAGAQATTPRHQIHSQEGFQAHQHYIPYQCTGTPPETAPPRMPIFQGGVGSLHFLFFFFAPHSEIQQHNYFRKACNIKVKRPKQEDTSEGLQGDRNNARSKRELLIYKIHGIPDIKEYIISLKKEQNIPFQTEHIQRTRKSFQKLKIH